MNEQKINLQLFTGEEGSTVDTNDKSNPVDTNVSEHLKDKDERIVSNNEPFAVFNDQKSFMNRVNREGRKQVNELLENLGFENKEQLESLIADNKKRKEAEMSELEKLQTRVKEMELANNSYKSQVETMKRNNTLEKEALKLGVDSKKMDYFKRMIDMSAITDKEDFEVEINKVLDVMPEFKVTQKESAKLPSKTGGDFKGNDKVAKKPLTNEYIRTMSTAEAEERMEEIMEFLSTQA